MVSDDRFLSVRDGKQRKANTKYVFDKFLPRCRAFAARTNETTQPEHASVLVRASTYDERHGYERFSRRGSGSKVRTFNEFTARFIDETDFPSATSSSSTRACTRRFWKDVARQEFANRIGSEVLVGLRRPANKQKLSVTVHVPLTRGATVLRDPLDVFPTVRSAYRASFPRFRLHACTRIDVLGNTSFDLQTIALT